MVAFAAFGLVLPVSNACTVLVPVEMAVAMTFMSLMICAKIKFIPEIYL